MGCFILKKESRKEKAQHHWRDRIPIQIYHNCCLACKRLEDILYPARHTLVWEEIMHFSCRRPFNTLV